MENTLEAFAEARRLGADGVELDVRLTVDGALAVHHDAEIPGVGPIHLLTVPELPPHVPLLQDAFGVCEGMVVNVEIKNAPQDPGFDPSEAVAAVVAQVIADAGWSERVLVSSFQVTTLRAVQVADGRLPLGALWPLAAVPAVALDEALRGGFRAVHPFVTLVDQDLVTRAHASGLEVNVWTVNADHDLAALVALGVDAVITDRLSAAIPIARNGPT